MVWGPVNGPVAHQACRASRRALAVMVEVTMLLWQVAEVAGTRTEDELCGRQGGSGSRFGGLSVVCKIQPMRIDQLLS